MSLVQLDKAVQEIASALFSAFQHQEWQQVRYASRWTPDGDVGADDFWLVTEAGTKKASSDLHLEQAVSDAARRHWRLTQDLGQSRWYMLTVTLNRDGNYSVNFEYRDNYQVGDIMESLQ
jgi:hypothetical protein